MPNIYWGRLHVNKTTYMGNDDGKTTTTIALTLKTTRAIATSSRNSKSGSRTNNMIGHRSIAMSAIGSATDLPPLQCRRINNVEVDIRNA